MRDYGIGNGYEDGDDREGGNKKGKKSLFVTAEDLLEKTKENVETDDDNYFGWLVSITTMIHLQCILVKDLNCHGKID